MMRKRYTPTYKAQVVRELLKEEKTLAQVAAEYGGHPTQLIKWRTTALEGLPGLFSRLNSLAPRDCSGGPGVQHWSTQHSVRAAACERGMPAYRPSC
jgi:transposase-like protein